MDKERLRRAAFLLTFACAVAPVFSIAASHILIGASFAAILLAREALRLPPIGLPLALFIGGSLISLAFSVDPWGGRAQVRKFYVFLVLICVTTVFRHIRQVRELSMWWIAAGACSATFGLVQFFLKWQAGADYKVYISRRITGFMSHWMTLGGQEMIVVLMAAALVFFSAEKRWRGWLLAGIGLILVSLLLGFTRSIWLGTFGGGVYLLWLWRRWWVLVLPAAVILLLAANPFAFRERMRSAVQPHGDLDSNEFRHVCRVAGIEMIKAHPWFGVGPEEVKAQFMKYIPPDIPRPLPTGWYGHLHNIYLHYAAERGIPTALMLFWFIGKALYDFVTTVRRATGDARAILHGAIAVMIGMLLVGFFELNLGDTEVLTMFLMSIACGYIAADMVNEGTPA